jgi:transcriptional regulator with XRE-family HTH domain
MARHSNLSAVDLQIAGRVRSLRAARGWSLTVLATRSGVSKAMISRVERGSSSPTAAILGRLAAGLAVTLSDLLVGSSSQAPPVRRRAAQPIWHDREQRYTRRQVAPPDAATRTELVEVELAAGAKVSYPAWTDAPYAQRLWLLRGGLRIEYGTDIFELKSGDSLDMGVDRKVVFVAHAKNGAQYLLVIAKP